MNACLIMINLYNLYNLYGQLPTQGIHTLSFSGETSEGHEPYLKRMGFVREGAQWILQL